MHLLLLTKKEYEIFSLFIVVYVIKEHVDNT
jgi:hypothetical protein